DLGPVSPVALRPLAGAEPVARQVLATAPRFAHLARLVLVNGEAGALFGTRDDPVAVIGFTIVGGRIAALNLVADQAKLRHLTIQPCVSSWPRPTAPPRRPDSAHAGTISLTVRVRRARRASWNAVRSGAVESRFHCVRAVGRT